MNGAATASAAGRPADTRTASLGGAVFGALALALLFGGTTTSIVAIWWRSETFTHGFFVLPIFLWLIWRERRSLVALSMQPDHRPLPLIAGAGLLWLISHVAGVLAGEQLALVVMLILVIWSFVGADVARAIRFPLLFLLFLAPLGEELVPVLMNITADLTVGAIALTGIPIYREGLFFSLPSGDWSVVEACSGIRYLTASVTLGSLYAYVSYRSTSRRLAFIALSAVVPIAANGIRAFLIVMIGHFSGMELATGVDHLIYGWLFFGIVMFVLFSVGALFHEPGEAEGDVTDTVAVPEPACHDATDDAKRRGATAGSPVRHALLATLCIAAWPLWAALIDDRTAGEVPTDAELATLLPAIEAAVAPLDDAVTDWRPIVGGYDGAREALLEDATGKPTVLALAYVYTEQRQGKEMISSANVLVRSKDPDWRRVGRTSTTFTAASDTDVSTLDVERTRLRSAGQTLQVWRWYRVGDIHTGDASHAKLLETRDRLLLRHSPSIMYVLAVDAAREDAEEALTAAAAHVLVTSPDALSSYAANPYATSETATNRERVRRRATTLRARS